MIAHVTLYFSNPPYCWVEQFFRIDQTYAAAVAAAQALAKARLPLLAAGVSLYRARVSVLGAPHASVSLETDAGNTGLPPSEPHTGLLFDLNAGGSGLYHRSYLMKGLPAAALAASPAAPSLTPQWSQPVAAWMALLVNGGWRLQCWGRDGPRYRVVNLASIQPTWNNLAVGPPSGEAPNPVGDAALAILDGQPILPAPQQGVFVAPTVRLSRVNWSGAGSAWTNGVNGEYDLLLVADNEITFTAALPDGAYLGGGYVQLRNRLYLPITDWSLVGLGTRKSGPCPKDFEQRQPAAPVPAFLLPALGKVLTWAQTAAITLANEAQAFVAPTKLPPIIPPPEPVPPPPPDPPPAYENPPPPLRPFLVRHLGDVGNLILNYCGGNYEPQPQGKILYAKVLSMDNTYLMLLGGTEPLADISGVGLLAGYQALAGVPNQMSQVATDIIRNVLPADSKIIIAGYSQGGAVVENLTAWLGDDVNRFTSIVTLAAPIPGLGNGIRRTARFFTPEDVVPSLTIWGFLGTAPLFPLYNFVDGDPEHPIFPGCHIWFCANPNLVDVDVFGVINGPGPDLIIDRPFVESVTWPKPSP